eukprot:scaffold345_cov104-Isochrysis_galbana.AAC.5
MARDANSRCRPTWAGLVFAASISPDVGRSRRCTRCGRYSASRVPGGGAASAYVMAVRMLREPGAPPGGGCVTTPAGLSTTAR